MRDTSVHERSTGRQNFKTLILTGMMLVAASVLTGCTEFVHMGQISDGEMAHSVEGVRIEQQQSDGQWRHLGDTDGAGKWWIMKDKIKGGGRVRLSKSGYYTQTLSENEFLQGANFVIVPAERGGEEGGWN
jgi:hypothetical protein